MSNYSYDATSRDQGLSRFFAQTYMKMGLGLFISFAVGLFLYKSLPITMLAATMNPIVILIAGIVQVILALSIANKSYSGNASSAMTMFIIYSVLNAITFVSIFAIFDAMLIIQAFAVTGITFVCMSIYGYTTKRNLSAWGNFLFGSLIGIIVVSLLNLFLHSSGLGFFVNIFTVIIFAGYMAYDTQFMRNAYYSTNDPAMLNGLSTFWALQIYMDIINMFINILQILGIMDDNN